MHAFPYAENVTDMAPKVHRYAPGSKRARTIRLCTTDRDVFGRQHFSENNYVRTHIVV